MKVEIIDKYRFGVTVTLALSPFVLLGAAALLWRNPGIATIWLLMAASGAPVGIVNELREAGKVKQKDLHG